MFVTIRFLDNIPKELLTLHKGRKKKKLNLESSQWLKGIIKKSIYRGKRYFMP